MAHFGWAMDEASAGGLVKGRRRKRKALASFKSKPMANIGLVRK